MTNLEAYQATYKNPNGEGSMELTLSINGITPASTDSNELSVAYAIHDQVMASDYNQGGTSETLSSSARSLLIAKARKIFLKYGKADPFIDITPTIESITW